MSTFGFIIIRHVNSAQTNEYWKRCYESIRVFHPDEKIIIIDDNSNPRYLNNNNYPLTNCEIIQSEFPARGEMLPFYYYYHNKFFDKAVILHDSMFLNEEMDIEKIMSVEDVLFLWHFTHEDDYFEQQKQIVRNSNLHFKNDLLHFHEHMDRWLGCFGVCAIITHEFMKHLFEKYNFGDLIHHIRTKSERCCLERIFPLICYYELPGLIEQSSLFGHIKRHPYAFHLNYEKYLHKIDELLVACPIVKVWSGR